MSRMGEPRIAPMRDEDWTSLVSSIAQGSCILMMGPNAITSTFDGERLPVLVGLARFVKARLGPEHADLDAADLSAVAQVAILEEDAYTLQGWVREFYENLDIRSTVLTDLAAMPFRLVVNTSPGSSLDQAFRNAKPDTVIEYYDRTAPERTALPDPTVDAPLIYNLYGSLERPRSLILSDNDRLDFLVSVIAENPKLPPKLRSALCDANRTFLFLGFGLDQWQLRILLHVLAKDARRHFKSFAFELDNSNVQAEARLFYKSSHKIQFYDMGLEEFTSELLRRLGSQAVSKDAAPPVAPRVGPDAPVAFLCHASEDKEFAEHLAAGLRRNGIATWLDKESLKGGSRWDAEIRQTLTRDVDYVVVIQSVSLKSKDIGYVNRELTLALERQLDYRSPRTFVIPVHIDGPENRLDMLAELQSIDLGDDRSINPLVQAINRDLGYAARERR